MPAKMRRLGGFLLALALAVALLVGCGDADVGRAGGDGSRGAGVGATATQRAQPTGQAGEGLPTIALAQLPREAQETIRLIDRGGPFPYQQDGTTFGNRERLLPAQPQGYYREYTVPTPGESDRGARRIIAGRGGELYYTDDHYESFKRVVR